MVSIFETHKQLKQANRIIKKHGTHLYNTDGHHVINHEIKQPNLKLSKKDVHHVLKHTFKEIGSEGITSIILPKIVQSIRR
jgi:hypothetical protein